MSRGQCVCWAGAYWVFCRFVRICFSARYEQLTELHILGALVRWASYVIYVQVCFLVAYNRFVDLNRSRAPKCRHSCTRASCFASGPWTFRGGHLTNYSWQWLFPLLSARGAQHTLQENQSTSNSNLFSSVAPHISSAYELNVAPMLDTLLRWRLCHCLLTFKSIHCQRHS